MMIQKIGCCYNTYILYNKVSVALNNMHSMCLSLCVLCKGKACQTFLNLSVCLYSEANVLSLMLFKLLFTVRYSAALC